MDGNNNQEINGINENPVNDAYGNPMNSAYGGPVNNAYGAPANNAYGIQPNTAYSGPANNAYGGPANNAYGGPANNTYGNPQDAYSNSFPGHDEEYSDTARYKGANAGGYDYGYDYGYNKQNSYTSQNRYSGPQQQHYIEDSNDARHSMYLGIASIIVGIAALALFFYMGRILYGVVMLIPIFGIVKAAGAIRRDKTLPLAYVGLVLNIIGCLPCGLMVLLWILNIAACAMGY